MVAVVAIQVCGLHSHLQSTCTDGPGTCLLYRGIKCFKSLFPTINPTQRGEYWPWLPFKAIFRDDIYRHSKYITPGHIAYYLVNYGQHSSQQSTASLLELLTTRQLAINEPEHLASAFFELFMRSPLLLSRPGPRNKAGKLRRNHLNLGSFAHH